MPLLLLYHRLRHSGLLGKTRIPGLTAIYVFGHGLHDAPEAVHVKTRMAASYPNISCE